MNCFTLRFKLSDVSTGLFIGEVEIDVSPEGDVEGIYLEGEDYTDNGEVESAIIGLITPEYIQRRVSELAMNQEDV